jgi:hypothetical protein
MEARNITAKTVARGTPLDSDWITFSGPFSGLSGANLNLKPLVLHSSTCN